MTRRGKRRHPRSLRSASTPSAYPMSSRTLVCGSLAYDTIMVFPDRFARHILPDQTHMLSVSFQIARDAPRMGRLRGQHRLQPEGAGRRAGGDGDARRRRRGVSRAARRASGSRIDGVRTLPQMFTAQAFIITDLDDNQITAFHPGAMNASHENRVGDVADIALGIVAPDGREGMRSHVEQFAQAKHSVRVRSGPGIAALLRAGAHRDDRRGVVRRGQRLRRAAPGRAHRACRSTRSRERVDALIVTLGGAGARIHADGATLEIPAVPAAAVVDPTGCGDAFRAGLLYGIVHGWDWQRAGRLASTLGSLKIASRGGQNHAISRDRVATAYHEAFHAHLW